MTNDQADEIICLLKDIKEELSIMKKQLDSIDSSTSSVSSNTYSMDDYFKKVIKAIEAK